MDLYFNIGDVFKEDDKKWYIYKIDKEDVEYPYEVFPLVFKKYLDIDCDDTLYEILTECGYRRCMSEREIFIAKIESIYGKR